MKALDDLNRKVEEGKPLEPEEKQELNRIKDFMDDIKDKPSVDQNHPGFNKLDPD